MTYECLIAPLDVLRIAHKNMLYLLGGARGRL